MLSHLQGNAGRREGEGCSCLVGFVCWWDFHGSCLVGRGNIWTEMKPKDMRWRVLDPWIVAEERGENRTSLKKGKSGDRGGPFIEP